MVWQLEEVDELSALGFELFPVRLPSLFGVAAFVASFAALVASFEALVTSFEALVASFARVAVSVVAPSLLCDALLASSSLAEA